MKLYYHGVRSVLAYGLALMVFLPTLMGFVFPSRVNASSLAASSGNDSTSTNSQTTAAGEPIDTVHGFIIERGDGKTMCRDARPDEVHSTMPKPGVKRFPVQRSLNISVPGGDNSTTGLTIDFDVLPQLNNDPNKATVVAAFQRAAAVWMARIKSPINIRIDIDYGTDDPEGMPFGAHVLGSTGSRTTLIDYPGARTNLLAGSSGPAESSIYNLLPGSFVPTDTGNGGVVAVNRSLAFALGIPVTNPADQNVASMSFNKNFNFDFNPDNGIGFGQVDFVAVAVHEIGHALGFTSNAGEDPSIRITTLWDLFRFRPGMSTGTFTTAERVMSIGGSQVYFTGESFLVSNQATSELALSTGGPAGVTTGGGDGNQSSHWKDDDLNGGKFIGIMDPAIADGVHEETTENDFKTLELLGWNLLNTVAPPPAPPLPPPPANDNFANAQVVAGCSGSVGGANIGATHESGEPQHFPPGGGGLGGGNRSVWYQWQAPGNISVTFTTAGSRFDTVLAVYTGSSVGALAGTLVGRSDDISGSDKTSSVPFNATAGTVYMIAVDGYDNNTGGDFGPVTLNWTTTNCSVSVQLSSANVSGNEGAGTVNVTVNRSGNTAAAATVNYSTNDIFNANCSQATGQASANCDYNTAGGTLRFAAGETSKNIPLSIVNDGYVEGNETFTLTLSNPSGMTLGPTTTTTITITDNDATTTTPFDDNAFFVRQQYLDFLLREPDPGGFNGWLATLNNCQPNQGGLGSDPACDRVFVSSGFFRSTEFGERGYWSYRYYHAALGRRPLFAEFVPDMRRLSGFLSPAEEEAQRSAFVADFMQRAEFQAIYAGLTNSANAAQFIAKLEEKAGVTLPAVTTTLPGQPPQYGRGELIQKMQSGEFTAAQTLRAFIEQKVVFDAFFFRAFVAMQYFGYLLRDPEDAGYNDWVDVLTNGRGTIPPGDFRHLIFGFVWSVEYRQRFGQP